MKTRNMSVLLAGALIASNVLQATSIGYANLTEAIHQDNVDTKIDKKLEERLKINTDNEDIYETFKKPVPRNLVQTGMSEHEKKDLEGLSSIKYFKLKTDANYELALSYGNGEYIYVEGFDSLSKAIDTANEMKDISKANAIPVVISSDGLVVYTTDGIAKIVKMKDGQPISQSSYIVKLYKDAEGKKEHSYIVHSKIDDVPVIEANEKMVKIEVAGFNGWIPRNDENGENLIMVPINDAVNLSFYQVNSSNQFIHSISTDVESEDKRESIIIGNPPSFMQPLKKYYSYDGMYFYENINTLIADLKSSNHNNAVNVNNPYYNYYNSVPGRSKTVYTASELNSYIAKNAPEGSALINTGESFIKHQDTYGVNALMALGIAINESGFGKNLIKPNNIFGINANDGSESGASEFASVDECIKAFMNDYMSSKYYSIRWSKYSGGNLGNKNIGVNVNYASDPFWGEKAASHMYKIDYELSGGKLKEYNNEQLGIYTKEDQVLSKDGRLVHRILNERMFTRDPLENTAQVGDFVLVNNELNGKYEISPDRAKVLRLGTHDWDFKGYINKDSVKLINTVNKDVKINILAGEDRYETAIKVSNRGWKSADNVVLVNSSAIVDALSATPFASSINAPILLTQKEVLNSDTEKEIKRLNAKNVYVIGGTSNIPESIVTKLKSMGIIVERISGDDRYETSLAVAKRLNNVSQIAVVNGVNGLPDAVSIAPVAAINNMPIVLSSQTQGVQVFDEYIKDNNIQKSYVIGSTNAISDSIANKLPNPNRLGGIDRNQTNAIIIENFYKNSKLNNVFVAKDGMKNNDQKQLIDALAVGVLAAKENAPVVIVGNQLEKMQKSVLSSKTPTELTKVGAGGNENAFTELTNMYKK